MFKVERLVQIMFVLLASFSGVLLGIGQFKFDLSITSIAIISALAAFLFNDILGWIRFNKWVANLVAIGVTAYSLSGFFQTTQTGKHLILIANLLVYLQAVLMFQRKTPRVCWQIMVLSLLQVVVAAAFNPGFDGAIFFVGYVLCAGLTMMLLTLFADTWSIEKRNSSIRKKMASERGGTGDSRAPEGLGVWAVFDQRNQSKQVLGRMMRHIAWLVAIGIGFTAILFALIPHSNEVWNDPTLIQATQTGISNQVDMEQNDLVMMSRKSVMTVSFYESSADDPVLPTGEPFFRGMALSALKIRNGNTMWVAPHDRVYQKIPQLDREGTGDYRSVPFPRRDTGPLLVQNFLVEPTGDPLLYAVPPFYKAQHRNLDNIVESSEANSNMVTFCRPLSALNREIQPDDSTSRGGIFRMAQDDELMLKNAIFNYELSVQVARVTGGGYRFLDYWPYLPEAGNGSMADNEPERRWLTEIDVSRYPTLVMTANQMAEARPNGNHLALARQMSAYFQNSGLFSYTLDFRNLERNRRIDAAEDFFANHRTGHCQYFASALTLMLRSQGIPARVVVGFRGGDLNEIEKTYDVQEQYAHAWVEAYIRPEDCDAEIRRNLGSAARRGCWLILDPTPAGDRIDGLSNAGQVNPLDYARDLWRDYVLGLDNSTDDQFENKLGPDPLRALSSVLKSEWWKEQLENVATNDPRNLWWYLRILVPILVIFVVIFALAVRGVRTAKSRRGRRGQETSLLRQILASAISLISPQLGNMVSGQESGRKIDFYQRFARIMKDHGLERRPAQTQLEFAQSIGEHFGNHAEAESIAGALTSVVNSFYKVRFADAELNQDERQAVDSSLDILESRLRERAE